ncbi:MAG: 2-oxoacid:acceptor oxidoreductase subunit alpha [Desulfobacteraceae bacterium]|jgi:2-oxoglutarate ferredoxin oxidoreductase subunit alpha
MKDLNVVIAGAAGEGVQTVGDTLAAAISAQGYAVSTWKEYESRIRGGLNSYTVRVGEGPRNAPLEEADVLLALNRDAVDKYEKRLKPEGTLLFREPLKGRRMAAVDFLGIARDEIGRKIYANTVAVGALAAVLGMDLEGLKTVLVRVFSDKPEDVQEANLRAAEKGYQAADRACREVCPWTLERAGGNYLLLTVNDAIPLGAAHAGCRFISAYPMTPSTGIITMLAKERDRLGVFAEQAEDEIAAINMAIGASFAGARAMTATSGGGFALMVEGLSLAGMTETPLVVVLAQRPGPATGLPTRTGQGELLFAIHAGHGEFARLILAPSDPRDAFFKTVRAFNLADQYQIPVILLTDQFLADAKFSIEDLNPDQVPPAFHTADPSTVQEDYARYRVTDSGISPRLIPGRSEHLVGADSDEHDEHGHITEDLLGTAVPMARKRLSKLEGLRNEVLPPEENNLDQAEVVLVGWGSSRAALLEALELLADDGVTAGMIHFTELWPLPEYSFPGGKSYWSVEGNATAQLARLLRSEYSIPFQGHIERIDGLPLTADHIRRTFHERNA